jgi:hypothetical protein
MPRLTEPSRHKAAPTRSHRPGASASAAHTPASPRPATLNRRYSRGFQNPGLAEAGYNELQPLGLASPAKIIRGLRAQVVQRGGAAQVLCFVQRAAIVLQMNIALHRDPRDRKPSLGGLGLARADIGDRADDGRMLIGTDNSEMQIHFRRCGIQVHVTSRCGAPTA